MKSLWTATLIILLILLYSCSPKVAYIIVERTGEPKDGKQLFFCERYKGIGADLYWLSEDHQLEDKVWVKEKK